MNKLLTLYYDNSGAIQIKGMKKSQKGKYYLIQEIVHQGNMIVIKIAFEHNLANQFIKTLPGKMFKSHKEGLGLSYMSYLL